MTLSTLKFIAGVSALMAAACLCASESEANVPYPEGYRHWTFLHSSIVGPKFSAFGKRGCEAPCTAGIFHFYANEKAMEGLRTGTYADGAIIAEEMLELHSKNENGREGARRMVGVMVKDSKTYATTGGWGFGSYEGDEKLDRLDAAAKQACYTCHVPRKDKGFVFTEYKER